MADDIKDRENKDAEESGRPVQLDREEQDREQGQQRKNTQHDEAGRQHQDG
jgi:hypothetical protein